jgi:hypothetical protein
MLQFDIDNRWPHAPHAKGTGSPAWVLPPGGVFFIDHMGPTSVGDLFHFETSVHRRQWIIKRYSARRLFTFSWRFNMAKRKRRAWTKKDIAELKAHSKSRTPVAMISKVTKRTVGALRRKAGIVGIRLGHRR